MVAKLKGMPAAEWVKKSSQGPSWPTMHLKQLKQRVEELHAILKL